MAGAGTDERQDHNWSEPRSLRGPFVLDHAVSVALT